MHESDLHAEETATRDVVDHVHALSSEVSEPLRQVGDRVGDVVHPGAAFGEELAHGRVFAKGREQLDAALTQPDRHGLDALRVKPVATLDLCAEEPLIRIDRVVEVFDGDAQMVDPLRPHARRMLSADGASPVGPILDTCERNDPADGLARA